MSTDWTSWHLHLGSDARSLADRVISGVVAPVAQALDGAPWFFMRYWQGGPHLRFRVGDLDAAGRARVQKQLESRLALAGRPAAGERAITAQAYSAGAEVFAATERGADRVAQGLREPGVHRAVYEPEYDRYGGPELMPRTEALFQLSSELVLGLLPHLRTDTARTSMALRGTMSAAVALDDPSAFYARSMAAWRTWAADSGATPAQLEQLCAASAVDDPPDPDRHGPFTPWHAAIRSLAAAVPADAPLPAPMIVFSHVHMLNNRLGRSLFEELRSYAWLAAAFPGRSEPEPLIPVGQYA